MPVPAPELIRKKEIKIYFTASSPPLGRPTPPEIDPYERHAHNWREPTAKRLEKEKKNLRDGGSREAYEGRDAIHSRAHPWSKDRVGR
jgi:hypothetical protein